MQALQLEISRALYMDQASLQPHGGFETLQAVLTDLVASIVQYGGMLEQQAAE